MTRCRDEMPGVTGMVSQGADSEASLSTGQRTARCHRGAPRGHGAFAEKWDMGWISLSTGESIAGEMGGYPGSSIWTLSVTTRVLTREEILALKMEEGCLSQLRLPS